MRCRIPPVLLLLGLVLATAGCGGATAIDELFTPDTPPGEEMTAGERALAIDMFNRINQYRMENEVPALVWDERAADAAYDHAVDMRLRSFYAHVNPDGDGPCERLMAKSIPMTSCGSENLARHNKTPEDAMDAFIASPDHRATLLNSGLTHAGVGVHTGRDGPWWVQDFFILDDGG